MAFGKQFTAAGALIALGLACVVVAAAPGDDADPTGAVYKIQPLDTIHVDVFGETNLCKDCKVRADGKISYPLLGNVAMEGLTTVQAQDKLQHGLLEWLRKPDVTVSITKYGEHFVVVMGQVLKQGPVILPEEKKWSIVDAIAEAGGFTNLAKKSRIQFTRDGKRKVYDYDTLIKEKDPNKKIWLRPGDVIVVPQSTF
jgi:polysaccharide biosynthesis/export protein